jgi:hypothetical protein
VKQIKKKIKFTQKDFFQQYSLYGWSFCSCQKQTPFFLDLSVLRIVLHTIVKFSEKLIPRTFAQNVCDYRQWKLLTSFGFVQLT